MKRLIILMLVFGGSFTILSYLPSCKHEPSSLSDLPTVCFSKDVLPALSVCAKCHSSGQREGEGFDPSSYSSIMKSVKAGDPWASKLYTIISSPNNPNMMPPKGYSPVSEEDRMKIEVWILQGAKETTCDSTAATSQVQRDNASSN